MRGPITDLTATLLTAWSSFGANDSKGALAAIDRLAGPDWYAIFKEFACRDDPRPCRQPIKKPASGFEHAYKLDPSALRVVEASGDLAIAQRHAQGRARSIPGLRQGAAARSVGGRGDEQAQSRREIAALAATAQAGAAEALYGLGASLGRRGGEDLGLVYLQLALYLRPTIRWRCFRSPTSMSR